MLQDSKELLERDRLIPEHSWNAGICQDICEAQAGVPPGSLSVDLLSGSKFLLYKLPKTGRGISYEDSEVFRDSVEGSYYWGGTHAIVDAARRTHPQARRDKTKTRNYRRQVTVEQMASAEARLKQLDLAARRQEEHKKNPEPRRWDMTRQADEHFPNQYVKEQGKAPRAPVPLKLPEFPVGPATPVEDYHSALEPPDSSLEEESTTDDEGGNTTCSEQFTHRSGHDTDQSLRTNTSD